MNITGDPNEQLIRIFERIRARFNGRNGLLVLLFAVLIFSGWVLCPGLFPVAVHERAVCPRLH